MQIYFWIFGSIRRENRGRLMFVVAQTFLNQMNRVCYETGFFLLFIICVNEFASITLKLVLVRKLWNVKRTLCKYDILIIHHLYVFLGMCL